MTYKSYFLILTLLFCTTIARAQYNQVNNIPYRDAAKGYARERCKLDVYYPTNAEKVVVVTGGAQGIGRCISEEILKAGAQVCVIDRQEGAITWSTLPTSRLWSSLPR